MSLANTTHPKMYEYTGSFELAAGKTIKLETSPEGEDFINRIVPEGKKWTVSVGIKMIEEDA